MAQRSDFGGPSPALFLRQYCIGHSSSMHLWKRSVLLLKIQDEVLKRHVQSRKAWPSSTCGHHNNPRRQASINVISPLHFSWGGGMPTARMQSERDDAAENSCPGLQHLLMDGYGRRLCWTPAHRLFSGAPIWEREEHGCRVLPNCIERLGPPGRRGMNATPVHLRLRSMRRNINHKRPCSWGGVSLRRNR